MSPGGPLNNLARAFAVHLEATEAAGGSPTTQQATDEGYKRFLTYLHHHGFTAPFALDLLNATNVRACAREVRQRSSGVRGGRSAARRLTGCLQTASTWLNDEGYAPGAGLSLPTRSRRRTVPRSTHSRTSGRTVLETLAIAADAMSREEQGTRWLSPLGQGLDSQRVQRAILPEEPPHYRA